MGSGRIRCSSKRSFDKSSTCCLGTGPGCRPPALQEWFAIYSESRQYKEGCFYLRATLKRGLWQAPSRPSLPPIHGHDGLPGGLMSVVFGQTNIPKRGRREAWHSAAILYWPSYRNNHLSGNYRFPRTENELHCHPPACILSPVFSTYLRQMGAPRFELGTSSLSGARETLTPCQSTTYKTHVAHQLVQDAPQRCNERCKLTDTAPPCWLPSLPCDSIVLSVA